MNHVTLLPTICFGFDKINGMLLDANVLDAVTIFPLPVYCIIKF